MHFSGSLSAKLGQILAHYGGWGIFGISFLDSSFLSLPLLNDLLLIHLSSQHPHKAFFYALQCVAGSVLGASLVYAAARAGRRLAWRREPTGQTRRTWRWLARNDFVSLLLVSLMPPPVPFKLFAVGAGALQVSFWRFAGALLVGRSIRFICGAWLGAHYGVRAEQFLKKNLVWAAFGAAGGVIAITALYRWLLKRLRKNSSDPDLPLSD